MKRQLQQIHRCDSCGAKFMKWGQVNTTANQAQIVCGLCKLEILKRAARSGWSEKELKGYFRKMPLSHMQVK